MSSSIKNVVIHLGIRQITHRNEANQVIEASSAFTVAKVPGFQDDRLGQSRIDEVDREMVEDDADDASDMSDEMEIDDAGFDDEDDATDVETKEREEVDDPDGHVIDLIERNLGRLLRRQDLPGVGRFSHLRTTSRIDSVRSRR